MATRKRIPAWKRLLTWTGRTLARITPRIAGALMVGAVAFYISYGHIRHTSLLAGQTADVAALTPFALDGLLIVAGTYAMAARITVMTRILAYAFFLAAWTGSLYANVQSAGTGAPIGHQVIAAWPAIATIGTAILLHMGQHKPRRKAPAKAPQSHAERPTGLPVPRVPVPVSPSPMARLRANGNLYAATAYGDTD